MSAPANVVVTVAPPRDAAAVQRALSVLERRTADEGLASRWRAEKYGGLPLKPCEKAAYKRRLAARRWAKRARKQAAHEARVAAARGWEP